MQKENNIEKALEELKRIGLRDDSLQMIKHIPAREGSYRQYPEEIHPSLVKALKKKGFSQL